MTLTYEEQRIQNIKDNQALLLSLGLATTAPKAKFAATKPKKPALSASKKRATNDETFTPTGDDAEGGDEEEEDTKPKTKKRKSLALSDVSASSPLRRSGRTRSQSRVSYSEAGSLPATPKRASQLSKGNVLIDDDDDEDDEDGEYKGTKRKGYLDSPQRKAQKLGIRTQDPKQFGHIPGVEVGRWWPSRMDCSTDAVHAPTVAGISGSPTEGAYSIALSGGYPDDVDLGVAFTYTGCGGRDLKGTKQNPKNLRTAMQTFDQSFDWPFNASLKVSAETRRPVRVIRGFKLPSPYAPATGYRYDGLYIVEKAWMAKGLTNGLKVCRYAFKRVEGQPDLPRNDVEVDEGEEEEEEAEAEL